MQPRAATQISTITFRLDFRRPSDLVEPLASLPTANHFGPNAMSIPVKPNRIRRLGIFVARVVCTLDGWNPGSTIVEPLPRKLVLEGI